MPIGSDGGSTKIARASDKNEEANIGGSKKDYGLRPNLDSSFGGVEFPIQC